MFYSKEHSITELFKGLNEIRYFWVKGIEMGGDDIIQLLSPRVWQDKQSPSSKSYL